MAGCQLFMERVMGFEPTTFCLGSKHSTPELHPLVGGEIVPARCRIDNREYLVTISKPDLKEFHPHPSPLPSRADRGLLLTIHS